MPAQAQSIGFWDQSEWSECVCILEIVRKEENPESSWRRNVSWLEQCGWVARQEAPIISQITIKLDRPTRLKMDKPIWHLPEMQDGLSAPAGKLFTSCSE